MKYFVLFILSILFFCNNLFADNVLYTDQEKRWINQNEVKVGMYPFYPPYAYIIDDESIIGLFPDLRELIKIESGLKFKQVFYPNWEAYLNAAKNGEIDIIMPIIPTEERRAFLNFTEPIVMDPHALVVRNKEKETISFDKLKSQNEIIIGAVKGYFITQYVQKSYPYHKIKYYADDRQCIKALLENEVDVFVTQTYTAGYFIRENENLSMISDIPTNTVLSIGVSKDKPILNQIIQKTIEQLPDDIIPDLINQWTYQQYQPIFKKPFFWMFIGVAAIFVSFLLFAMNKYLQIKVRKRTNELMNAKIKAEESENLKTAFVLNISHEIRTPLNAINGFSELMALQFEDNTIKEYSKDIIANSHRLTTVIESMIIFAQLESSKIEFQPVNTQMCYIIEAVSVKYKEMYPEKLNDIKFEIECSASNVEIETDPYYLRKMLGFVLDNAFKFTQQGRIRFGFRVYNGQLNIFIEDTGIGIKREAISEIFNRFYKFSVSDEKFHAGTGVGLSVAKKLSEELGFELNLDSEFGHGTVVNFLYNTK
jgi:signal transduction histidine kinase